MIWYLLYPFRGTTDAPTLAPSHPVRTAFTRYGRQAASRVVTTLHISVAVAAMLVYPFPFLYTTDFINGASNLPHHVWTDAKPLLETPGVEPDVIMRSIWVHGNRFEALDRNVLLGALELQDELLGPTMNFSPVVEPDSIDQLRVASDELTSRQRDAFHVRNGLTNESWFFHSPLQYWNCSREAILADPNIIATVNEKKTQPTSVNVTLRHSIVFSGKRFEDRNLVAADAIVVTLIHLRDSPIGRIWERKAAELTSKALDKWDIYNQNPHSLGTLYEFQFLPMSVQDTVALTLAYSLAIIYFLISLSKLRAVKSKTGLMLAIGVQLIVSILSSFTVCAIFKIDLSRIPRFGYPVVIFSMSLENIFRLINAVIMTPSENSTSHRIGHAFGETAHVALASVVQNILILWGLSNLVSPGVASFCKFVAIAIVFDFFYLSTFFLSVLSVDVRRTELSDTLAKASLRLRQNPENSPRQSWIDAMLEGKIALSTRIAGTVVMVGFVMIAQWHFFENESVVQTLLRPFNVSASYQGLAPHRPPLLVDIHQARSPTAWLRLQDHETAREVIHVIKPDSSAYIARVMDPLIFVMKGADRTPRQIELPFLPAVYDFARHQSAPFVFTVLIITAAVRLLTNYLLWDEIAEAKLVGESGHDGLLTVETLTGGHALDIALLATSSNGFIVSTGFDRVIRVWDVKDNGRSSVLSDTNSPSAVPFPVLAMAIDQDGHWLALLTADSIRLYDLRTDQWGPSEPVAPHRQRPEAFFFGDCHQSQDIHIIVVRRDGVILELRPSSMTPCTEHRLLGENLVASVGYLVETKSLKIVTALRDGGVHVVIHDEAGWSTTKLNMALTKVREPLSILVLSEIGSFMIVKSQSAELIDANTLELLHTFKTDPIQPKSLKCHSSRRSQAANGHHIVTSITLTYLNAFTRDLVIQTYLSPERDGEIHIGPLNPAVPSKWCTLERCREGKRLVKEPGEWEILADGTILGVRKKLADTTRLSSFQSSFQSAHSTSGLRSRSREPSPKISYNQEGWEVWVLSYIGKLETWETVSLVSETEDDGHLFVGHLGRIVRLGRCSIAVALSNVIKVIFTGPERFTREDDSPQGDERIRTLPRTRRPRLVSRGSASFSTP